MDKCATPDDKTTQEQVTDEIDYISQNAFDKK